MPVSNGGPLPVIYKIYPFSVATLSAYRACCSNRDSRAGTSRPARPIAVAYNDKEGREDDDEDQGAGRGRGGAARQPEYAATAKRGSLGKLPGRAGAGLSRR